MTMRHMVGLAVALVGCAASEAPLVQTPQGAVQGFVEDGVAHFLGIPLAQPPVGALRFSPPVPIEDWGGTLEARESGPLCPQLAGDAVVGKEDCLYLDVRVPEGALDRSTPLPVMVWVHGGALTIGGLSMVDNDTSALVRGGDVIVVSLPYRLGVPGFLATPALQEASGDGSVGNYGLRDLELGLEWVRASVGAFGGDPDRVTLVGQSAGAANAAALSAIPSADGLFQSVILQSSPSTGTLPDVAADGMASGMALAEAVGCPGSAVTCLRDLPVDALVRALSISVDPLVDEAGVSQVVDGVYLPEQPLQRVKTGRTPSRRWMVGSTREEAGLLAVSDLGATITQVTYPFIVGEVFGDDVEGVLEAYPASLGDTPLDSFVLVLSEALVTCPTQALAESLHDAGQDVLLYRFDHRLSGERQRLGAFHALDVYLLFDLLGQMGPDHPLVGGYDAVPADLAAGEQLRRGWTQFAQGALPDGWVTYQPGRVVSLSSTTGAVDVDTERCEVF